jgi:cytolysin-activating lysine-acyltransferase
MRESLAASAQLVMKKIPVLGAVAWLMMQKGPTRNTFMSELEWRVMPPLVLDQCKLYLQGDAPTAFVSWAKLSPEVVKRYRNAPHRIGAGDWRSGREIWLMDFLVPFGGEQDVLQDLRSTVFAGRNVHQLAPQQEGEARVITWPPL